MAPVFLREQARTGLQARVRPTRVAAVAAGFHEAAKATGFLASFADAEIVKLGGVDEFPRIERDQTLRISNFGGPSTQKFFADHGWREPSDQQQIKDRVSYYAKMVPAVPEAYHRLMHDRALQIGGQTWRCISGWGHSPEHMALYCDEAKVLISGDMVLPKISTNVSVYAQEPEANSLSLFMRSLHHFDSLPADTLVLPSHGRPFVGLHTRTAQLLKHHEDRLDEVLAACSEQAGSAHDMLTVIFKRPLDFHQTTFAIGESVAHLHALWFAGKMSRHKDAQGVWRFKTLP